MKALITTFILMVASIVSAEPYQKQSGVVGNLNSMGSDTLNNLMTYWAEGFRKVYPGVIIQIEGKGSSTAPPALIAGTAQVGPMSRSMKNKELEAFEKKYGYKPTKIAIAIDSLAVFVHKDNPIVGLTIPQVDAIFSKNRLGGYKEDITLWSQVGVTINNSDYVPISLYGRNSVSGTYGFFKKRALFKGDFKDSVKEQPGSASVVNSIGVDSTAIGYSGIGYKTSDVRIVPLAKKAGKEFMEATFDNVINGSYPLGRALYVYINKKPGNKPSQLVYEFMKFVLSDEGQDMIIKSGYGKLTPAMVKVQLNQLK